MRTPEVASPAATNFSNAAATDGVVEGRTAEVSSTARISDLAATVPGGATTRLTARMPALATALPAVRYARIGGRTALPPVAADVLGFPMSFLHPEFWQSDGI